MPRIVSKHQAPVFLLVALLITGTPLAAEDWPTWRGVHVDGVTPETGFPLEWSAEKNVRWKVALEDGSSMPLVIGDHVLLTTTRNEGKRRSLLCLNRATGAELWESGVDYAEKERTHDGNPYCSSSPACDGERVYVWHSSAGLFCYNLEGEELWRKDLGKFEHIWGYASSPAVWGDVVIVNAGPGLRAFVAAFDKLSGEEVWRFETPEFRSKEVEEFRGSWSTPVVRRMAGRDQLLLSMPDRLHSLDPADGKEIWSCAGMGKLVYTSPLVEGEIVVAMSGYHQPALAVRADGTGDVTQTHRLWHHAERNPQRVGSGLVHNGHIYMVNEPGSVFCIELKSGEKKWEARAGGKTWSSLSRAGDRFYMNFMNGDTTVFRATPEGYEELAVNSLGETTRASLAFSEGEIFQRTYGHLYCISEQPAAP